VTFDVTPRVSQWSVGGSTNYGWRMSQAGTTAGNNKVFDSSEEAANTTLRPKLTIVYSGGGGNTPPTVSLTSPASNASITLGQSFTLTASASDSNGVAKVEFFANGASLGPPVTAPPYTMTWTPTATGAFSLTAVATDTLSLSSPPSAAVPVNVNPASGGTTVVLQRGLNGYAGVADTFLDQVLANTVRGSYDPLYLELGYTPLIRFAIFQSEGGPVPNNATIQSATLALNKGYYNETLRLNAMLKPWVESQATWNVSQSGVTWTVPGAAGAGSDYQSAADASVAVGFNPGWVTFDVTPRVSQWSVGGSTNYGWRMSQASTTAGNNKVFDSSEEAANTTLRPKLTIVYN
jgi:hypothetical protein